MEEIFLDIKGWEGKHQVSNYGRIKTLNYKNIKGLTVIRDLQENSKGYFYIVFSDKNRTEKHRINRLEAITFNLPIPEEIKHIPIEQLEVDHIDCNRKNNRIDNLRWKTHKGNCNNPTTLKNYANSHKGLLINRKDLSKPILQYDLEGNFIREWQSSAEVKRVLGYNDNHIRECCNNKRKTSYGYKWVFKN